jgi:hypothetical protein
MKSFLALGLAASSISLAQAHGVFSTIFIDGASQGDRKCLRTSFTIDKITSPITDLDSADMACGVAGQTPADDTCSIKAGAKLSFEFRLWASGTPPGTIDPSHLGPMAIYAKQVDDSAEDPTGTGWFKLWEYGYDEASSTWATEKLIANDGIVSVQIPTSMATGSYLIRPEILALHNLAAGPAQFYVGCAQISVLASSGSSKARANGNDIPADKMVSIPGYIKASDPAVNFNSHPDAPKHFPYILGGPAVYEFPGTKETDEIAFSPLDAAPPVPVGEGDGVVATTTTAPTATDSAAMTAASSVMATPTGVATADDGYNVTTNTSPTQTPTAETSGQPSYGNNDQGSGNKKCHDRRRRRVPVSKMR